MGMAHGLVAVGVADTGPFDNTRRDLEERRALGLHGGMEFTYRKPYRSTDPRRTLPEVEALVVGAAPYGSEPPAEPDGSGPHGRVARYVVDDAYGRLAAGLEAIAVHLREGGWRAVVIADQNHLVDREAAHRAGVGWYGKSSNLLVPGHGSFVVLGSVLTDAPLEHAASPVPDGCGSCRRCLDGCPTGAIVAPGVVDARRCLAWLVQSPDPIPVQFREALGDRLYGCDDCQEVCPPNRPLGSPSATGDAWVDVIDLLDADDETLMARHGRWYIPDRDPRYLRRTALVVLGNIGDPSDPDVQRAVATYVAHEDGFLAEHAAWAAARLAARAERATAGRAQA